MKSLSVFKLPITIFITPAILVFTLVTTFVLHQLGYQTLIRPLQIITIIIGSAQLIKDTFKSIWNKQFALDYIAILAIITGVITQQYTVALVICLMLSGGNALEEYARQKAQSALQSLINRIPSRVNLSENGVITKDVDISQVKVGTTIAVKKGEVIPLDGSLISDKAEIDEASLTGEPYPVVHVQTDKVRSGTLNIGELIEIKVTSDVAHSTYRKIIDLVSEAQSSKSPFIRLADRYSIIFTMVTFVLAGFAYAISGDPLRILAVLVLATPCPLILATPVALIGGMNTAAKNGIVIKNLASLEVLARVNTIVFDKTGTLTLGTPQFEKVKVTDSDYSEKQVLQIAASIERNSLHPIAKAIMAAAKTKKISLFPTSKIQETIGTGISAVVNKERYLLSGIPSSEGITVQLKKKNKLVGEIFLKDLIKANSKKILKNIKQQGVDLHLFSGDTEARVKELISKMGCDMSYKADCEPEDKTIGIKGLQKDHRVVAMVGDGINDAPALAQANVGVVFSSQEQSASSEAADVVLLGNKLELVLSLFKLSKKTIRIALESIWVGLGLSIAGMVLASLGFIPPIVGALSQELIDVAVIVNAIRTSRLKI